MAATVAINEKNGVGETATDKTSGTIRYKNADNATVDLANPMVIPGAGSDFSWQKFHRLNVGGTFTQLTNLKFYMDGASGFGTGVLLWAQALGAYATPAEETSSVGYLDAFSYTVGAPLSLGAGPYTAPGDIGSYLKSMLEVASTAAQGRLVGETMTFAWDEI